MTQKISPTHLSAVVPFNESYPIDFSLYNSDNQAVLYIDDTSETLNLELTNTSKSAIKFGGPVIIAINESNYHFALRFRPGTLVNNGRVRLGGEAGKPWMLLQKQDSNGFFTLYLKRIGSESLEPGKTLTLPLENLVPAVMGGSRGTQVELLYRNLSTTDQKPLNDGIRTRHLAILNHQGRKQVPLHVGFAGSNAVLNDGTSTNRLTLRITNTLKSNENDQQDRSAITLRAGGDAPCKLILTFIAGDPDMDWALGTDTQVKAIMVDGFDSVEELMRFTTPIDDQPGAGIDGTPAKGSLLNLVPRNLPFSIQNQTRWNIRATQLGDAFDLTLIPCDTTQLFAGDYIEFSFSNIVTAHPDGTTDLFVHYANFPGYWDGDFACPIEKAPLVFRDDFVGIGTTSPTCALDVNGSINVGEKLQAQSLSAETLELRGGAKVSGSLQAQSFSGIGAVPSGAILLWYGKADSTPDGWKLCDGKEGRPNLSWQGAEPLFYLIKG